MLLNKQFILASNSASRKKLLKNAGLNFLIKKPLCDEEYIKIQLLKKIINRKKLPKLLAKAKALSVSEKNIKHLVVGSDTIIFLNNKIINKAQTVEEAEKKLLKLSGKKHQIVSGVSVCFNNKQIWSYQQTSTIYMNTLNQKQINTYLKKTGKDILSSVGCYQVEKLGPQIIKSIKGDFFNVLGFPLFPFLAFLSKR
ncbi:Maf family nucleotide pyrophosphatase [Alphaproteobacteria bacterium]|nr:Maf family nucleotide pyrophosphatase [Alphaproteobacteria bacterium]